MKKIFLILFLLGIISCENNSEFSTNCLPLNLQKGVIAFYPFNSGSLNDEFSN